VLLGFGHIKALSKILMKMTQYENENDSKGQNSTLAKELIDSD